jgi:hypothetical protein
MKYPSLVLLLTSVCLTGAASAAWNRLPSAEGAPVNLANPIIIGTQLHSSSAITNPSALLTEMSGDAANLGSGKSEAVISIGEQQQIDSVSFLNDGVAGKLVVSASSDAKDWDSLAQAAFTATDRYVAVKFAGAQAKYVRLAFDAGTASSIRNLKISGPSTAKDYKTVPVKESKGAEVNLSSPSLGAQPIYMFPTPENMGENEGAQQAFKFPKSKERYRTVVYDLGSVRTVKKFSAAYTRVPTRIQAYAFEQLPEKKDWRGKMTLDPAIFDEVKPVATAEDARGDGNLQLVPERPVLAQYVALRFEPNYQKQSVTGLNPDLGELAFAAVVPFSGVMKDLGLIEVSTFTQAAAGNGEFIVYDTATGGTVPLVIISKAAIALVMQQLGPGATEQQAIDAILTAAGFSPISNSATDPNAGGGGGGGSGGVSGDPSNSPGSTAGLNALGLSAYRGSGGTGGSGPFSTTSDTSGGGTTNNNNNNSNTGGGGTGGSGPVIIAPTTP